MNDELIDLLREIDDARIELEELNESGDLESRMECAMRIEDLERRHFSAKMKETGG